MPRAPQPDRNLHVEEFTRSAQQNIDLGLYSSEALQEAAQEEEEEGLERVVEGGQESSSDEGSDKEDGEEGEGAGGAEGGRGASVMGTKAQKQALLLLFDSSSKPDVAKEVRAHNSLPLQRARSPTLTRCAHWHPLFPPGHAVPRHLPRLRQPRHGEHVRDGHPPLQGGHHHGLPVREVRLPEQ